MASLDDDEHVLEELRTQGCAGLTDRGKMAIKDLADNDQGATIFLILSLNKRIQELEIIIAEKHDKIRRHH